MQTLAEHPSTSRACVLTSLHSHSATFPPPMCPSTLLPISLPFIPIPPLLQHVPPQVLIPVCGPPCCLCASQSPHTLCLLTWPHGQGTVRNAASSLAAGRAAPAGEWHSHSDPWRAKGITAALQNLCFLLRKRFCKCVVAQNSPGVMRLRSMNSTVPTTGEEE